MKNQRLSDIEFEERVRKLMNSDNTPKLVTMWVDGSLLIMEAPIFSTTTIPNHGELRLALEFIEDNYPLFKHADLKTKADFIRDIFKFNFPTKRLKAIKPYKKFIHRTIVTSIKSKDGKYIVTTKRVLKHK